MFAKFVAIAVTLVNAWLFVVNIARISYDGWVLVWILASGLAGVIGGVVYLLSTDGPERFATRSYRISGWVAMLAATVLPTSLNIFLMPMVLLLIPTLLGLPKRSDQAVTSV